MFRPARFWSCTNQTRQVVLASQIRRADHYFARLAGLLPKNGLGPEEGLWILPCHSIHSIGMRFAFDALFLDADLKVVHCIQSMPPMRVSPMIKTAKTVIELAPGTIIRTGTAIGDQLLLEATRPGSSG